VLTNTLGAKPEDVASPVEVGDDAVVYRLRLAR
jgi:hypothetical protein